MNKNILYERPSLRTYSIELESSILEYVSIPLQIDRSNSVGFGSTHDVDDENDYYINFD